jgi:hypothetical protein
VRELDSFTLQSLIGHHHYTTTQRYLHHPAAAAGHEGD